MSEFHQYKERRFQTGTAQLLSLKNDCMVTALPKKSNTWIMDMSLKVQRILGIILNIVRYFIAINVKGFDFVVQYKKKTTTKKTFSLSTLNVC